MKKFILITIFTFLFPTLSFAVDEIKPKNNYLPRKINKILNEFGEDLNIGILVEDAATGEIVYQKNANRYFTPASNQKLFTAFAALNFLNLSFAYQTQLFADLAKIQNGVLNDDIYLKFSGDPTLTFAQFDRLISSLKQAGIQRINGSIIIDDTAYDQITMSPGTTWDDKNFCFGSPISALILDHNCVSATLLPSPQAGQFAYLVLPNQPQFMYFINQVTTQSPSTFDCKVEVKPYNENTYIVNGCIKTTDHAKSITMAINNPRTYIQSVLAYLLKKYQITTTQNVQFQKITKPLKLLSSEVSEPLDKLVTNMLKDSDNTIANSLFKTMGSLYTQSAGSWQNGHNALHDILAQTVQIDIPRTTLIDGAGGSRYNYVTPKQVISLLRKAYASTTAPVFISALPISGVDGTLRERLNRPEAVGRVHAKTGTVTGVTSLSGYLVTRDKRVLAFSIMINGFIELPGKYKVLEDKICMALIEGQPINNLNNLSPTAEAIKLQ